MRCVGVLMEAVSQLLLADDAREVVFGANQPEYQPLPALVFPDGRILIEWTFTEEERARIARGENLRHWIWKDFKCACGRPRLFEPVQLQVTDERVA